MNCIMNEQAHEIAEDAERLTRGLPEDVKRVLRAEALKRGVPLAQVVGDALRKVAGEIMRSVGAT